MHDTSWREMRNVLGRHADPLKPQRVLDVGSAMVNQNYPHTYRELCSYRWDYVGMDIEAGKNVDVVMTPYSIPAVAETFDIVLCGQCLEHVEDDCRLVREMARVLTRGGLMILTAPREWPEHRYPADYRRYLPDGLRHLVEAAGVIHLESYIIDSPPIGADCWAIGRSAE